MANVTHHQRTFAKAFTIDTNSSSTVLTCTDTSGNTINCNYIAVSFVPSAAGTGVVSLFVSPQVGYTQVVSAIPNTSLSGLTATSSAGGFCLAGTTTQPIQYEYLCNTNETFSQVVFRNLVMGGTVTATFGHVRPINDIKLKDNYLYPLGR